VGRYLARTEERLTIMHAVRLLQVERLGHRGGAGRLAQPGQAEELLRGAEQGVVVEQRAGPGTRLGARADDQGRDAAAHVRGVRRALLAAGVTAAFALVPGDEDNRRAVPRPADEITPSTSGHAPSR